MDARLRALNAQQDEVAPAAPTMSPISPLDMSAAQKKLDEAMRLQREYEEKVRRLQMEIEGLGYVKKQVKLVRLLIFESHHITSRHIPADRWSCASCR